MPHLGALPPEARGMSASSRREPSCGGAGHAQDERRLREAPKQTLIALVFCY
jgi:hypothetical protein